MIGFWDWMGGVIWRVQAGLSWKGRMHVLRRYPQDAVIHVVDSDIHLSSTREISQVELLLSCEVNFPTVHPYARVADPSVRVCTRIPVQFLRVVMISTSKPHVFEIPASLMRPLLHWGCWCRMCVCSWYSASSCSFPSEILDSEKEERLYILEEGESIARGKRGTPAIE